MLKKPTDVKRRKASEVTDPALGESQLFVDIEDFGRVRRDGFQEGLPMDDDPDTQHSQIQIKLNKKY